LVIEKKLSNKTQTRLKLITQRSTGRQKQARFLPVVKLLVKGRYRFKRNSFFAFAACELSRYSAFKNSDILLKNKQIMIIVNSTNLNYYEI